MEHVLGARPPRGRVRLLVSVAAAAAMLGSWLLGTGPVRAEPNGLQKIDEFRPFGTPNPVKPTNVDSVVDSARRNWFLFTTQESATDADAPHGRVRVVDLDRLELVGSSLPLPGATPIGFQVTGLDAESGLALLVYAVPQSAGTSSYRIAAIGAGPEGPRIVADQPLDAHLSGPTPPYELVPMGMDVVGGKAYIAVENFNGHGFQAVVSVLRLDVGKLVANTDPFDWRYDGTAGCQELASTAVQTAVGRSRSGPWLSVTCTIDKSANRPMLQGVLVVTFGDGKGDDPATFKDTIYPIGGDFKAGDSMYDPGTDRMMMRRTGPAQVVTFDVAHRVWLPPLVFGQGSMVQLGVDPTTGRLYGQGEETSVPLFYAAEIRPTPPQNGVVAPMPSPTPLSTDQATGILAVDPATHRIFVNDYDGHAVGEQFGQTQYSNDGLFFHVYRDDRPAFSPPPPGDPDTDVVSYSGEAQGYGARVSYVGGVGGTFSNTASSWYGTSPTASTVQGATRHFSLARTIRMRLSEGEAVADATGASAEGAGAAELSLVQQPWPYTTAHCSDRSGSKTDAATPGASVACDLGSRNVESSATYGTTDQSTPDLPIQHATTTAKTYIDAARGVVTSVTSEASFDVPGVLRIGKVTATAETWAAGADGKAGSSYTRTIDDVWIAGQQRCDLNCDPEQMAQMINDEFASLGPSTGTEIVASVPHPDAALLSSPGGAQAIVQRDFWDHQQDMAIHDGAEDRMELPAFVVTVYRDGRFPEHYVYWFAGVQAVSRFPRALADKLTEMASPWVPSGPTAELPPLLPPLPVESPAESVAAGPAVTYTPRSITTGRAPRSGSRRRIEQRLGLAFASPIGSPGILLFWAFLSVPVYLAARRRLLVERRARPAPAP